MLFPEVEHVLVTCVVLVISANWVKCETHDGKCPNNLPELDKLMSRENWSLYDLECVLKLRPTYLMEPDTGIPLEFSVVSNCEIKFVLERKAGNDTIIQTNCSIFTNSTIKPDDGVNAASNAALPGLLQYENMQSEYLTELYKVNGIIPACKALLSSRKSRYKISVARPDSQNFTAISNTPLMKTEPMAEKLGWVWDHFQETVPLYPDQIAIIVLVGDVKKVEYKDENKNRTISISWTRGKWDSLDDVSGQQCIAKLAMDILSFSELKLGIKYPLQRLDIVASREQWKDPEIKKHFGIAAVDSIINYIPDNGSCQPVTQYFQLPLVAGIAQHWLGFVKTPTNYSRELIWGIIGYLHEMQVDDSTTASNPENAQPLITFQDMYESLEYDTGYRKIMILFKMLETLVTTPVFSDGIASFVKKVVSNEERVEAEELFGALQDSINKHNKADLLPPGVTLKTVYDSWYNKSGRPLIRVGYFGDDSKKLTISQTAETFSSDDVTDNTSSTGFWIPLQIVFNSGKQFLWLSPEEAHNVTLSLESPLKASDFVVVNPNEKAGFYRILYDKNLTILITNQLVRNHTSIPRWTRRKLIEDYFRFADMDYIGLDGALELLRYFGNEDEPIVWEMAKDNMGKYWPYNLDAVTRRKMKKYFGSLVNTALKRIGFTSSTEDAKAKMTRQMLIPLCIELKTPDCIQYAKRLMTTWKDNPDTNPFEGLQNDPHNAFQCLALNGTVSEDQSGLYDFYTKMITNKNTTANGDLTSCGLPSAVEHAMYCTGNPSVFMPHLRHVVDDIADKSACMYFTQAKIGKYPWLLRPLFDLMKNRLLDGKLKLRHLLTLVNMLNTERAEGEDIDLLDDMAQLIRDAETAGMLSNDDVEIINDYLDDRRKIRDKTKRMSARNGLRWLEAHGY